MQLITLSPTTDLSMNYNIFNISSYFFWTHWIVKNFLWFYHKIWCFKFHYVKDMYTSLFICAFLKPFIQILDFHFCFIDIFNYITGFPGIKPSLPSWNNDYLIIYEMCLLFISLNFQSCYYRFLHGIVSDCSCKALFVVLFSLFPTVMYLCFLCFIGALYF